MADAEREHAAATVLNEALALTQLDRHEDELRIYDDLIDTNRDDPTPTVRERVAAALYNKGWVLDADLYRSHEASLYAR